MRAPRNPSRARASVYEAGVCPAADAVIVSTLALTYLSFMPAAAQDKLPATMK